MSKFVERIMQTDSNITSKELKQNTKMTYRQINDWEDKGYLKPQRKSKGKWRKFTKQQYFALLIFSELKKVGAQPPHGKWLINKINSNTYLEYAISLYEVGVSVNLITDLSSQLYIFGPTEHKDFWEATKNVPAIYFCINSIIDRFLKSLGLKPRKLDLKLARIAQTGLQQHEEKMVSNLRSEDYDQLSFKKTSKGWKGKGKKFLSKEYVNEISEQKKKGKSSQVITNFDRNGKITNANIEEELD